MKPITSCNDLRSDQAIQGLLQLIKAVPPFLDVTYGSGVFWKGFDLSLVVGCDVNPNRAKDKVEDFKNLSFKDEEYETVVFDPPFHPFVGSAEEDRFSGMGKNEKELKINFEIGLKECWRVAGKNLIVKCQDYIHNHKPVYMTLWAVGVLGEPFEWMTTYRSQKRISGRWKNVKSLYRNHASYLIFNKNGNHR